MRDQHPETQLQASLRVRARRQHLVDTKESQSQTPPTSPVHVHIPKWCVVNFARFFCPRWCGTWCMSEALDDAPGRSDGHAPRRTGTCALRRQHHPTFSWAGGRAALQRAEGYHRRGNHAIQQWIRKKRPPKRGRMDVRGECVFKHAYRHS